MTPLYWQLGAPAGARELSLLSHVSTAWAVRQAARMREQVRIRVLRYHIISQNRVTYRTLPRDLLTRSISEDGNHDCD